MTHPWASAASNCSSSVALHHSEMSSCSSSWAISGSSCIRAYSAFANFSTSSVVFEPTASTIPCQSESDDSGSMREMSSSAA